MRNFISGLFGIWIVLVTLVLSPGTTQRVFLVVSGIAVTLIAFWPASPPASPSLGGSQGGSASERDRIS